jgi:hypothetical protein
MGPYGRMWLTAMLLSAAIGLACCATISSLTGPSQDFVAAANALAQAESDYFDEIQAASDASYQLQAAEDYVGHNGTFKTFAGELSKHDDFSKAKKLRMTAMAQLQNYAQQIAAITSGASTTWISNDAKTATTNITALVKDAGATADAQLLTSDAGLIQTAVTDLGQAIISHESAKELQTLAQQARDPIAKIADMVKQDNANIEADQFTASLKADQSQALHDILHFIYDDQKVNAFERFNAIQMTANWKPSLVTKGQDIQSPLEKLQAANDALAKKEDTSLGVLSQQAYTFAMQALNTPALNASAPAK